MQYLIDTHILLWFMENNPKLTSKLIEIIEGEENEIFLSFASFWELSIKSNIGKIDLEKTFLEFEEYLQIQNFQVLSFDFRDLDTLQNLTLHHQDPFDRMIIAQAITKNMTILTNDSKFQQYPVSLVMN